MNKSSHLRDKKIDIVYNKAGVDKCGYRNLPEYEPIKNGEKIWAYYRQLSQNEFISAMTNNLKTESLFEISWRSDLNTDCKIRYKNQIHEIIRIDDFEGNKEILKIYTKKIN